MKKLIILIFFFSESKAQIQITPFARTLYKQTPEYKIFRHATECYFTLPPQYGGYVYDTVYNTHIDSTLKKISDSNGIKEIGGSGYIDNGDLKGIINFRSERSTLPIQDTVLVIGLVIDTSVIINHGWGIIGTMHVSTGTMDTIPSIESKYYNHIVEWWYLYSVRQKTQLFGDIVGNYGLKDYWQHLYYLDFETKKLLPPKYMVWLSKEVK